MSEHNAVGTRVLVRPAWTTFLLLFITSGLYRTYWAWRVNSDLATFGRERVGSVAAHEAIRVNPGAAAFFTFLLLPGASLVLVGTLFSVASVPAESGFDAPSGEELGWLLGIGIACLAAAFASTLRTARRIRAARVLAGLAPSTLGAGRAFPALLLLEVVAAPASLFALQHALNDLWSRYPPLLDEDLHGELAPAERRDAAVAQRPALHEARLSRIADELEQPRLVPWISIAFGVLCVAVFAWQLSQHGPFPSTADIERVGGFRDDIDGMWWRFWTANVLHGSVDHLAGNMFAWSVVAVMLERVVGHARMLLLIVVGAAGCSAGAFITNGDVVSVGASGVIFAAFGLAAMVDPLARRAIGKLGWSTLLVGLGFSTFTPGVSSGGHVGGAAAGLAVGAFVTLVWRFRHRAIDTDAAALRAAPLDRSAPLAPDRELSIAERVAHLARRRDAGELSPLQHDRLHRALAHRG
ncbi:MAG: Rhomboid family protein [Thermoleophilia bacterium]|nr:Rhomboid family protein [Thermoleophilia bacterium]